MTAADGLWIVLITCWVAAFDYFYRSLFSFSPEFFVNHSLDRQTRAFFESYGKIFRFGGLATLWLGALGCYLYRNAENPAFFHASIVIAIIGGILHQGEQGWLFLMKKKK